MDFLERMSHLAADQNSRVCIGLDPDLSKFPECLGPNYGLSVPERLKAFAISIVNATAPFAVVYKPNLGFWASHGAEKELAEVINYIHEVVHIFAILDAKYGDIGNTAKQYAKAAFQRFGADAVTLNAYLGCDTLQPFLDWGPQFGVFVLAHTSNRGAGDFQEQPLSGGDPLFVGVAKRVTALSNPTNACVGLVMGATFPAQFNELGLSSDCAKKTPLLIPGIGTQGGDLQEVIAAVKKLGCPFIINSSSGIIHASTDDDFAAVAAFKAKQLRDQINLALAA